MASTQVVPKGRKSRSDELLDAERIFCAEYLATGSLTAATRAGWPMCKAPGIYGQTVISRPRVRSYLGSMLKERLKKSDLSTDRVLRHITTALSLDPLDLFEPTPDGSALQLRPLEDVPEEVRLCIKKLKSRTRYTNDGDVEVHNEIEFCDKDKILELAMKYLGMLKEGVGVHVSVGGSAAAVVVDFDKLCNPEGSVDSVDEEEDIVESHLRANK